MSPEVHEIGGILRELHGRHDRAIDVGLRAAGGFHAYRQQFIHPRLGLIVPQSGLDQGDDFLVLLRRFLSVLVINRGGRGVFQNLNGLQDGLPLVRVPCRNS